MRIRYLGTAAAEGVPALFCKCPVCMEANKKKGRYIRTRSQLLVNDDLLIDFGPDAYLHILKYGIKLDEISNVLITHNHQDHLLANEFEYRRKGFASIVKDEIFKVYGSKEVCDEVNKYVDNEECKDFVIANEVKPYTPFKVGKYEVVALKANHSQKAGPYNYIISDGIKSFLYAHDTGYFFDETWEYLKTLKKPLDLISLDCTAAILSGWRDGHLSFDVFVELIGRLKEMNVIDENTKVIANHFSHNGKAGYKKMKDVAKEFGVVVSYDGMKVNI